MKNTKGITLIALIITIIVMLILVAVSISVALNTGLFKSAGDATKNWKSAQDAEANVGSEIKIGDKIYSSIEEYIEDTKPLPEGAGKRFSETKEYTDGTKTAWIPAGFTVSGIRGETTIEGGLVIYDIPENEIENVKWDGTEKTKYNQFVWIPVEVNKATDKETEIASFKRNVWQDNARVVDNTQSSTSFPSNSNAWSNYTEPNTTNDTDGKTGIASQIENLTKSIYKYGGFYIGRYEAGSVTPRTNKNEVTSIGIKQDMYPYNFVKWGDSMSVIGTVGAVALSNSLYNSEAKPNYGATSMLCTGASWDSMLDFIKDAKSVTNSVSWGIYNDVEFDITRGRYAEYANYTLDSFTAVTGTYTKEQYKDILLTTGASERNSAKNIYDIAGNCYEWTTESYSSGSRVSRGGSFNNSGSRSPASNRSNSVLPSGSSNGLGFRPVLYVNL